MIRPVLIRLLALAFGLMLPAVVRAQGTFVFSNAKLPEASRVVGCDGKPVGGTNFLVEARVVDPSTGRPKAGLLRLRDGKTSPLQPLTLLSGRAEGRFGSVTVQVPGVPGGETVTVRVRVWDRRTGRDYEAARIRGEADVAVRLGGQGSPPAFPGMLARLPAIRVCPVK